MIKKEKCRELKVRFLKSFISFILVFIAVSALDLALYFVFNSVFTVPEAISQIISYTLTTLLRYSILKLFRFGGRIDPYVTVTQAPRFIVVSLVILSVSTLSIAVFSSFVSSELLVKLLVTATTGILNTFGYRFVFTDGSGNVHNVSVLDKLLIYTENRYGKK